jgi:aminomethyltransferase
VYGTLERILCARIAEGLKISGKRTEGAHADRDGLWFCAFATETMSLKRTPLYSTHVTAGAKLVDFGGWEMPLNYGSQIEEHHAVRKSAGMFDVSHMCPVDVEGAGAKAFLQLLLANDVAKLGQPGKALYSAMLNPAGGVIDDLIVYFCSTDRYRVVVNASTAEKDLAHMRAVAKPFDAAITPRQDTLAMIAVQGPEARAKLWQVRPQWQVATATLKAFFAAEIAGASGEVFIARTGYTGEDGFEIMLPAGDAPQLWLDLQAAGVAQCGLAARDTLRLEAGMNLYGNDMDETVSPLDAGMGWTVDRKSERDFIGRAALDAAGQTHAFMGLKLLEKGVIRSHMKVVTTHGAGETTSGTFSPSLGASIALARVPKDVQAGDAAQVDIRGRLTAAVVVKPPFVRNGTALI